MKKTKKIFVNKAKVINKGEDKYFPIPGKMPTPTSMFLIEFLIEDSDKKIFEVDRITFNNLEIGDEGTLKYTTLEIISFANKIVEL